MLLCLCQTRLTIAQVWSNELKDSDTLPPNRCADFLESVLRSVHIIIAVDMGLRDALTPSGRSYTRSSSRERISDAILDWVSHFGLFVSWYGPHLLCGKRKITAQCRPESAVSSS